MITLLTYNIVRFSQDKSNSCFENGFLPIALQFMFLPLVLYVVMFRPH